MSVEQMREALRGLYLSDKWREKVKNMSDRQVMGVYYSFLRQGKLKK